MAHVFYRPATFRIGLALARILPRPILRTVAVFLGAGYFAFVPQYRRIVVANLAHLYPNQAKLVRQITCRTFLNYARTLADYCSLSRLTLAQRDGIFHEFSGREHLDAALAHGRGVILVTAHLGNWELGGLYFRLAGYPLRVVTQEEPTPELHTIREQYRAAHRIETIPLGNTPFSFLAVMSALRENQIVAMLIDRPHTSSAIEVEFAGKLMPFSPAPVALAQATGAAILPGFVVLDRHGGYRASIEEPLALDEIADAKESLRHNTQKLAAIFERAVRANPDQWFHFVPLWKQ